MHKLTVTEIIKALKNKQFSSQEITEHFLNRIQKYNPELNSFITIAKEGAINSAKQADNLRAQGSDLPLLGLPIGQKDLFCVKGMKTTCGSKMLDNFIAPYSATVVENLEKAGTVMLGKLNTDEFAMGSSNQTSFYGVVRNPWNTDYIPGGSSGGSASAVGARLLPIATGTDTGGSIRQPAAFNNLTGLKPTYGMASRYGMIAYASSLDQAGLLGQNAEDVAVVLNHLVSFDSKDSTSYNADKADYTKNLNNSIKGLKIGVIKAQNDLIQNEQIKILLDNSIKQLELCGATIKEIELPHFEHSTAVYYIIATSEASSNLSRYDGVRFGHRTADARTLQELYVKSRSEGFGDEVQKRIILGTFMLSAGHFDAYYVKAQKVRRLILNDFVEAFKDVDAMILPTTPRTAWKIGEKPANPQDAYLEDKFSTPANLAGLPAINMQIGFINDLPVGAQIIAPHFSENLLLNIVHQYQAVTDWHKQIPNNFI